MPNEEKLENFNLEITCRACLVESDQLTSLFAISENNCSIAEIYCTLAKVELNNTNDLPTKICDLCQQDLLTSYHFKLKVEKSENILFNFIRTSQLNRLEKNLPIIKDEKIEVSSDTEDEVIVEVDIEQFNQTVIISENDNDIVDIKNKETDFNQIKALMNPMSIKKCLCKHCSASFHTQQQLDQHNKVHENNSKDVKFYCQTCDKFFVTNRNLQRHLKIHFREQLNNPMNNNFDDDANSIKEESMNLRTKDFISTIYAGDNCDDNTDNSTEENDHLDPDFKMEEDNDENTQLSEDIKDVKPKLTKHKIVGKKPYSCNRCSAKFSTVTQLESHSAKAHSEKPSFKKFYCSLCDRYFVTNRNLQRHLTIHYGPRQLGCSMCDKVFKSKFHLKMHEKTHEVDITEIPLDFEKHNCQPNANKLIECKICGSTFHRLSILRDHLINHNISTELLESEMIVNNKHLKNLCLNELGSSPMTIIQFIMESFKNNRLEKFYLALAANGNELSLSDTDTEDEGVEYVGQDQIKEYKCELCDNRTFSRRYQILHHQRNDHESDLLPFKCDICEGKYCSQKLLDTHLKKQCRNVDKLFQCNVCKLKFMWKENVENHFAIHHTNYLDTKYHKYTILKKLRCDLCFKKFNRSEHLDRHQKIHFPAEKKFQCIICHKRFSRKDNLRTHMKIHDENRDRITEESKSFLCGFCGRKFRNSSNLVVHTRRHTGEKPFNCDFCDKAFPRSSDLRTHRRTHTGEKPHLCTLCGKGFSRSNKLTRHMRIHTGIRPYQCTFCDKAFTQSNDLTIHVRRHTGEKPYVCGVCGVGFIQGTALQNHRKMHGHYEDKAENLPFGHISKNNPTPQNSIGRVDRIGMPKNNAAISAEAAQQLANATKQKEEDSQEAFISSHIEKKSHPEFVEPVQIIGVNAREIAFTLEK